ncbi:MAG: SCO family protein [Thermoleophilaceae bacterium]
MHPRVLMALVLAAILALGALVLVASQGGEDAAAEDPLTAASGFAGSVLPDGVRAPNFALANQDGETVRMRDFRGAPVIVTFLYTTCDESCPPQAQQTKGALDQLGHDVPALAIAVDPETDTPERARAFLSEQRMTGRMDFVLGTEGELRPLWDAYAIQPQLPDAEHQARIVIVDGDGLQRVAFPLEQATPERIAHDVRALEATP